MSETAKPLISDEDIAWVDSDMAQRRVQRRRENAVVTRAALRDVQAFINRRIVYLEGQLYDSESHGQVQRDQAVVKELYFICDKIEGKIRGFLHD